MIKGRCGGDSPAEGVAKDRASGLERGGDFPLRWALPLRKIRAHRYLFLFTIRDSNFPEAISMKRVKSEILFSAFSAFQIKSVNSSILSVAISTGTG